MKSLGSYISKTSSNSVQDIDFVLRMAGVSNMIQNNYLKCYCLSVFQNDHYIEIQSVFRIIENS